VSSDGGAADRAVGTIAVRSTRSTVPDPPTTIPVVRRPPISLRVGAYLVRNGHRGGYRLLALALQRGWLDRIVRYRLSPDVTFDVPLFRPDNRWDAVDVREYDPRLIDDLAEVVRESSTPPVLVDCGADIGVVSVLVVATAPRLHRIVAIEPNPVAYAILESNMRRLPVKAEAMRAAIADSSGWGALRSPSDEEPSDHSKYVVEAPDGDFPVVRVDDLMIEPDTSVILKLDVEGAELAAIKGALGTLRAAPDFAVSFEAHPRVVERTGIEPTDIIRLIKSVRDCTVKVSDVPAMQVMTDRPFFSQVTDLKVMGYNVLCRSVTSRAP
jgi:FkbM family methyltransferase